MAAAAAVAVVVAAVAAAHASKSTITPCTLQHEGLQITQWSCKHPWAGKRAELGTAGCPLVLVRG